MSIKIVARDAFLAFVVTMAILATLFAAYTFLAPKANADDGAYNYGCETVGHPTLLNWIQKRSICDGPRRPDGSWNRVRIIWTPAHTTNGYCSGSSYYVSCSPARSYDESIQEKETYVVFDSNVLADEPGWLPAGTDTIR